MEQLAEKDDRYFLRWLRARKFDLAKAEDMLRKVSSYRSAPAKLASQLLPQQHIETRKKYKLDTILTDYKPNEVQPSSQECWKDFKRLLILFYIGTGKVLPRRSNGRGQRWPPCVV